MKPKILLTTILSILLFASCSALRRTTFDPRTHDEGVVINGVRWATRNVDMPGTFAPTPESPGMLYQWNRKKGWNVTDIEVEGWDNSLPTGTVWYAENDPCPNGWRVPTEDELRSLLDTDNEWITKNWINGRIFGIAPYQIFLPFARWRINYVPYCINCPPGYLVRTGMRGYYWSNTKHSGWSAIWILEINRSSSDLIFGSQAGGFSIRCVSDD